jgi:hypothetical protein
MPIPTDEILYCTICCHLMWSTRQGLATSGVSNVLCPNCRSNYRLSLMHFAPPAVYAMVRMSDGGVLPTPIQLQAMLTGMPYVDMNWNSK